MQYSKYEVFAYQVLHYLVTTHNYQIVRVEQHKDDIWLMNSKHEEYPVIRISSKSNDVTFEDTQYIRNVHRVILELISREGPILILNTNPESSPINNATFTQVRITPEGISDERLVQQFSGIQEVVHEVIDAEVECIKLTKSIEEAQIDKAKELPKKSRFKKIPKLTGILMLICLIYTVGFFALSFFIKDSILTSIAAGAFYKMNVVAANEYWRLFTSGFLHVDLFQLLISLYALFIIGRLCESAFSKSKYLIIFISSILVGNICLLVMSPNVVASGMSGGIMGLLGAYIILLIENKSMKHPLVRITMLRILYVVFFLCIYPGISIMGNIGGFITGCLLGIIMSPDYRWVDIRKHCKIASGMLVICLGVFVFKTTLVEPSYHEIDEKIVNIYKNTPLNFYGTYLESRYNLQYKKESSI